jgi:prepilin-type N-terminal cleavage/methylation domain-containing protein
MINSMKGFTLIETLVAVLLLALSIAGPLTIASKGLTATLAAKDQFVAFYLAQDALEYVRYRRDSACLAVAPAECTQAVWLSTLNGCVSTNGTASCQIDTVAATAPAACGAGGCSVMTYDPATKIYAYSSTAPLSPQRFIRTITITNPAATLDEALITVTVSWTNIAGVTRIPVTVRESIFRWQ